MFAAYAARIDAEDPLSALEVGERPEPEVPDGWTTVTVEATALNHHDLWSLRGVGMSEDRLPMILGCDAAGVDADGNDVIVHSVISDPAWRGDETLDPSRSLLSEKYQGTLAAKVAVPKGNLVRRPTTLAVQDAACLPTAWLTAYRMLFTQADVVPGQTVLVQGAGGGVATALIALGAAAGVRVWVTSRDVARAERTLDLGADQVFESGARLPDRVDAVFETVGEATWSHSLKSLRPGGTLVVAGATSGYSAVTELNRVFFLQLRILGSTMGTRNELERLVGFLDQTGIRPEVDSVRPLADARDAFARMAVGDVFGKLVVTP